MKNIILSAVMLTMVFSSYSQALPANPTVKIDYLAKSKNQKTIAWLMLGGGTVIGFGGYVLFIAEGLLGDGVYSTAARWYRAMWFWGGAAMLGSIPVFIAAARNKGMGMAGLKLERIAVFHSASFPAIAFTIHLK
jgi:hypothetical protein